MTSSTVTSVSADFAAKMTKFSVKRTWLVENFAYYRASPFISYQPLQSPTFSAPEHDLQFKVFFYPNGTGLQLEPFKNYTAAFVQVSSISGSSGHSGCEDAKMGAYWKEDAVIAVDYTIESVKETVKDYEFDDDDEDDDDDEYAYNSVYYKKYSFRVNSPDSMPVGSCHHNYEDSFGLLSLHSNGHLLLECKINVTYPADSFSGVHIYSPPTLSAEVGAHRSEAEHLKLMLTLLMTGGHSDVTLVVDGIEFCVHKALLAAQSTVFEAMFRQAESREKLEGKVLIEDVSAGAIRFLLYYIYTGAVESRQLMDLELLQAAEKYQVEALKVACERQLTLKLTTDSVFSLLLHADMHSAARLKENCIQFATFNSAEVMRLSASAWKQFIASARPELFGEVVTRMLAK